MDNDFVDGTDSDSTFIQRFKGPRKLNLDHWRYKLLHWVFGIKPATVDESRLPSFLYTHYCPLFHVTNTLAVLLPFIIIAKLLIKVIVAIVSGIKYLGNKLPKVQSKPLSEEQKEINKIWFLITECGYHVADFDYFWRCNSSSFTALSKENVQGHFNRLLANYFANKAEADKKKEAHYKLILWLSNIGSTVVRYLGWAIYGAGTGGMIIGAYYLIPQVCEGVAFFVTNIFTIAKWTFGVGFIGICLMATGMIVWQSKWFSELLTIFVAFLKTDIAPRNGMLKRTFRKTSAVCGSVVNSVGDFVHTVYENNCPPIIIVTDEVATSNTGEN